MDPHNFIARAEAQRWLGVAEKLLLGHDIVGSKSFAIKAKESDPTFQATDQILAIIDTLLASEKRVPGTQELDYYAVLQLNRFVINPEHIADMFRRLAFLLNPNENRFPYSEQAFELVNDAWAVLSNPMRKSFYDSRFPQINNNLGFHIEQHYHQRQFMQHNNHQQPQYNFLSINNEHELAEPNHSFQVRLQRQLQQHNFLLQPQQNNNSVGMSEPQPNSVRMSKPVHLPEQVQIFHPMVQTFQFTSIQPEPQPHQHQHLQPEPQPQQHQLLQPEPQPQQHQHLQPELQQQQHQHLQPEPQPPQHQHLQPEPQPPQHQHLQPEPPQQHQHLQPEPQPQQHQRLLPEPQPQQHQRLQPEPQPQQHQHLQPEPQPQQHQHLQPEPQAVEQDGGELNANNVVREEEVEAEVENESNGENVDQLPSFWTACPYCLYMFEYPRVYVDCVLRCGICKRAHQAVPVPCPPIVEGEEKYFCCWGYFPVGVSLSDLEKNKAKAGKADWTPVSTLNDVSSHVKENLDMTKNNRIRERTVYIDDVVDDIFEGVSESESSDYSSDVEWGTNTKRKKVKRMKKDLSYKKKENLVAEMNGKNLEKGIPVEEDVGASTGPSNSRRQSRQFAKDLEKLDLNVVFNNNEGEEAPPRMAGGTRRHGQGDEDSIEEGIGFFEGLDEFFSNLPILSVGNDETVKAG